MQTPVVRLGALSFLNAYPFRLTPKDIDDLSPFCQLDLYEGTPSQLNLAMADQQLQISLVSSAFYLRHQDRLVVLNDLAIGSDGPTESVYLAFPAAIPPELDHIAVPQTSETSVALAACWLECHAQGMPQTETWPVYEQGQSTMWLEQGVPTLLIGDEALTVRMSDAANGLHIIDLGQWWRETTGTPFVFALWVAQADFAQAYPQTMQAIEAQLQAKKSAFLGVPSVQARILRDAAADFPKWPLPAIQRYLTEVLSYHLGTAEQTGLHQFGAFLARLDAPCPHRMLQRLP